MDIRDSGNSSTKNLSLHLSEDELKDSFNLRPGWNEATFSVTTQYQGK